MRWMVHDASFGSSRGPQQRVVERRIVELAQTAKRAPVRTLMVSRSSTYAADVNPTRERHLYQGTLVSPPLRCAHAELLAIYSASITYALAAHHSSEFITRTWG